MNQLFWAPSSPNSGITSGLWYFSFEILRLGIELFVPRFMKSELFTEWFLDYLVSIYYDKYVGIKLGISSSQIKVELHFPCDGPHKAFVLPEDEKPPHAPFFPALRSCELPFFIFTGKSVYNKAKWRGNIVTIVEVKAKPFERSVIYIFQPSIMIIMYYLIGFLMFPQLLQLSVSIIS